MNDLAILRGFLAPTLRTPVSLACSPRASRLACSAWRRSKVSSSPSSSALEKCRWKLATQNEEAEFFRLQNCCSQFIGIEPRTRSIGVLNCQMELRFLRIRNSKRRTRRPAISSWGSFHRLPIYLHGAIHFCPP